MLRKGALSAAVRLLGTVSHWGIDEIGLVRALVSPERLLNAAAEERHGAFGEPFGHWNASFFWGAMLSDAVGKVQDFYKSAGEFITRVVGLRYEGRLDRLDDVSSGDVVSLIWDRNNPYDSKAILVLDAHENDLGYLRSSIANQLVQRLKKGSSFSGKVAVLLGDQFGANERLYIKIRVGQSG